VADDQHPYDEWPPLPEVSDTVQSKKPNPTDALRRCRFVVGEGGPPCGKHAGHLGRCEPVQATEPTCGHVANDDKTRCQLPAEHEGHCRHESGVVSMWRNPLAGTPGRDELGNRVSATPPHTTTNPPAATYEQGVKDGAGVERERIERELTDLGCDLLHDEDVECCWCAMRPSLLAAIRGGDDA
jgi:hypothetical protein